jgi:ketosteroid isomerase-like protein
MSNVEIVRTCIDAITRQDGETLRALSAADVEVYPLRSVLEDTVYRGHDGVDQWMRDLRETWGEVVIDIHDIAETEPDYVVAKTTLRNRGHQSDVPTEMPVELHGRLRDGLVVYARVVTAGS